MWLASETRNLRSVFLQFVHASRQTSAECRTSSVLILRICTKSFNHHEDLACDPSCWCCQCFSAPTFLPHRAAATQRWAKASVYCQKSFWAVYLVSAPPSRVLRIVCKSSNQHAHILFHFTASREALISSSHLGCLLFKSNGWFLWRRGLGFVQSWLLAANWSLQCPTTANN